MMRTSLLTLLGFCCLAADVSASLVTLDSTLISARVREGTGATSLNFHTGADVTVSTSLVAEVGDNRAETSLNWAGTGTAQTFGFGFDHQRDMARNSFAKTDAFDLTFSVAAASTFALSGEYSADVTDGTVVFAANLYDVTQSTYLFSNIQESRGSALTPETFVLGGTAGNWSSVMVTGSLNGVLQAGHQYRLFVDALIQGIPTPAAPGSASGFLNLEIVAVPEPGTLLLLPLCLMMLARKRSNA